MKKQWIIKVLPYMLIIGFIVFIIGNKTNATQNEMDLTKIANSIEKYEGSIVEWSLYAREYVYLPTKDEWFKRKKLLEKQFPEFRWTLTFETGTAVPVGFLDHGIFTETIKIIPTDTDRQSNSYVMYEVKGTTWNQDVSKKISERSIEKMELLFDDRPVIFSCIKGEFNEELDEFLDLNLEGFLQTLQAKEIESLKEREFYSISAYSSLFVQTIHLTNQDMNMQIGLRKNRMGPGTSFVIGTPILVIEY